MTVYHFWVDAEPGLAVHRAGATVVVHGYIASASKVRRGDLVTYGVRRSKKVKLLWRRIVEVRFYDNVAAVLGSENLACIYPGRAPEETRGWLRQRMGAFNKPSSILVFHLQIIQAPAISSQP